jgi:hypothetical protein
LFYFWKSDQELRSFNVGVHPPTESKWNKYLLIESIWCFCNFLYFRFLSIVRKSIVGFLLFGSLSFNIFGYFSSGFEFGVKMCELDMEMFVANLSVTFDVLKRLNGLYIMVFHLTQARFRGLLKKKFGNCCQRTPPKKQQSAEEVAETKVWIMNLDTKWFNMLNYLIVYTFLSK